MATCRAVFGLALLSMVISGLLASLASADYLFDKMFSVTGELAKPMLSIEQVQTLT